MKKLKDSILILCIAVIVFMTGCGSSDSSGRNTNQTSSVNDVIESEMAAEDSKNAEVNSIAVNSDEINNAAGAGDDSNSIETPAASPVKGSGSENVDVDLTTL